MFTCRDCRRGRLTLALALALVSLAGCAQVPGSSSALVGSWRSSVQFSAGAFAQVKVLEFLYVFNSGGTMVESSNYDATPPVPPAYGEWRQTGERRFEARYTFFTTGPLTDVKSLASGGGWLPSGSGVLTEQITLSADGRTYDSRLALELFDRAGKPVPGGGEAAVHARRLGF